MPHSFDIKNKSKSIISICLFLNCLFNSINAQTFYNCRVRLLHSSEQISEQSNNYLPINKAVIDNKKLILTLQNKKIIIVSTDTVWGYQIQDNNQLIRAYNGGLYKVKQINSLILYSQKDYGSDFFESIYYFSQNLDSEIHLVDKSTIRKVFSDNVCILYKLNSCKLWKYPTDWDKKYNTVRFMVWYNECNLRK